MVFNLDQLDCYILAVKNLKGKFVATLISLKLVLNK